MYCNKISRKKRNLIKIFGGLNCGSYDTQKNRRECNDIIRKHLAISQRHIKMNIDNKFIKFNDLLIFIEKLTGQGKYGKAYLSTLKYKNQSYDIIIKQQIVNNKSKELLVNKELQIIQYLSSLVENNVSPHFLHYYNDISTNIISLSSQPTATNTINNFNEYIKTFIVEKASGVFSELINTKIHSDFNSIISQIIISIYTFHQYTKCYHCDTHRNNFLYHELIQEQKTYIKYKLDNNIYKLKLSNYLIILWDYGLALPIKNTSILSPYEFTYMIFDYHRIFNIIYNYCNNNAENQDKIDKILNILEDYDEKLLNITRKHNDHKIKVKYMFQLEKEMIYTLIKENLLFATNDIFSKDYIPYNAIPYDLENTANYKTI